jgi:hypothetical protein
MLGRPCGWKSNYLDSELLLEVGVKADGNILPNLIR